MNQVKIEDQCEKWIEVEQEAGYKKIACFELQVKSSEFLMKIFSALKKALQL